jgi:uncharacterized protein (DUF1778 family)
MKSKPSNKMPSVSKEEVHRKMPKSEALLLRLTLEDKDAIATAASALHLTVTEFLTKSALMVASKVGK